MMIRIYLRMIFPLLIVTFNLAVLNFTLNRYRILPEIYDSNALWLNYLVLVPLSIAAIFLILKHYQKNKKSVGKSFFIYVVIKMVATLLFLSPWLLYKDETSKPMVYHFFALFFPLLITETWILVRLLNGRYEKTQIRK